MLKIFLIFLINQNASSIIKDAEKLFQEGKYELSRNLYKKASELKIHPLQKYKILLRISDIEMEYLNMYDSALENLLYAKSLFSENAYFQDEVFYRLGVLYEKMGNYKKAAEYYQIVITKFRKSKYWKDAFDAVERCFRKNVPEYVAKIGEIYITLPELEKEIENVPSFARPKDEKAKAEFLDKIIERKMLSLEAKERGLYLKSSYIEKISNFSENILINTLWEEVSSEVKVSEEEIKKFYLEHIDDYKIPEKYKFVRIEVKEKGVAEDILKRIKKGEIIESLAVKYSIAPDAKNGGIVDNYTKGSYPKEYYDYVSRMKINEVKIFENKENKNFAIVKLLEKTPEKLRPIEEVKDAIERRILNEKQKERWEELIKELKEKYKVENYLKENVR
jgi:peptidyl-prolyl cis-trans isomerase C